MLKDNGFTPAGSESDQGLSLLRSEVGISSTTMDIVYESRDGSSLMTEDILRQIEQRFSGLKQEPYVSDVRVREEGRKVDARQDVVAVHVILYLD